MATYDGPSPGAAQYGMYAAQAQQALQNAQARIQQQRSQLLTSSGLSGIYGSNGQMTGFNVASGPGSQFGSYQQMTQGMADQGAQTDAASSYGGLGFGGGLANHAQALQHQADSGQSAAWGQGLQASLGDLSQQDQQNQQDYNSSLFSAFQQQVQDAVNAGTFNPADFSGITIPGYGNPYSGATGTTTGTTPGSGAWTPPPPKTGPPKRRRR